MNANRKIGAALAAVVLLAALPVVGSFWALSRSTLAAEARRHSYELLIRADAVLGEITDAESAQRGFTRSGNESFLESYLRGRDLIRGHLEGLRSLTPVEAAHKHLDALAPLIEAKLAHMAQVVELRRERGSEGALLTAESSGEGSRLMESIRTEMGGFIQVERDVLAQRNAEFQSSMHRLFVTIVTSSVLMLLFTLLFARLLSREVEHRIRSQVHLDTQHLLELQETTSHQLRQANTILQLSEAKLAVTLNSIGDAVITTDTEGYVTLLNPLAEQLTGWARAEAIGRPVDDIFRIINQETRRPSTIPVRETLARGTIQGLANHTILIARGGGECPIADSCAPIRDCDGVVIGAVLVFRDVTAEDAARRALRDQQFYTRSLIDSSVDALMTTDPSGLITDVNKQMETLTGRARDELIGTPFGSYFTDAERAEAGIKRVLEEKSVSNYELTVRAKDGRETPVSYNAATIYNREGLLQGVFAAARDVTEREHLYQMLQERNVALEGATAVAEKANLAKSDFLSSMSHELRTPLNAILGFAQLMESAAPAPTLLQKRSLEQILKAGWYLLDLINEILDLALIESGKVTLSQELVSLVEVIEECRAMIEPQAQSRGIRTTFPRLTVPYFVSADRTRIKQVLINLLSNAIKYNRPGGAVAVECTYVGPDSIRVSVRDTGAGLLPAQLEQLFQPFNRLGTNAAGEEGTGIGLVVTKRLVELMGGTIGADSTVDVGSVFWIELSRAAAPPFEAREAEPLALARPHVPEGTPPRTVLYVEDNPANLELVDQIIARRPDLRLISAVDGNLGIQTARSQLPDVILMDLHLPGIGGTEAMQILRADPLTAHIPVIALSANALHREIAKGLAAGFFTYLTKPLKVSELYDALDVALKFSQTLSGSAATKETT